MTCQLADSALDWIFELPADKGIDGMCEAPGLLLNEVMTLGQQSDWTGQTTGEISFEGRSIGQAGRSNNVCP
ncbi:MAG: hypothetical protein HND55_05600 [Pseudomonadota bacterium]|nr:MAG: hypothetical protein HND55_05600 [Pseudomonadota bacterium]